MVWKAKGRADLVPIGRGPAVYALFWWKRPAPIPRLPCLAVLAVGATVALSSPRSVRGFSISGQCIVIHSRASRRARARSVFDMLAEISERSSAARAEPLMAAMLNHLWAAI